MSYTANTRTVLTDQVPERSTSRLKVSLLDEDDAAISGLTSLTMTLHDEASDTIINSRVRVDISSSFTTSAGIVHYLSSDDNVMINDCPVEDHIVLLQYSWSAGARKSSHEVVFPVRKVVHSTSTST